MGPPVYRDMDQETLNQALDVSAATVFQTPTEYVKDCEKRSVAFRSEVKGGAELRYGPGARNCLDWFPAEERGAPTLVFIHGGFWQYFNKEQYSYIAAGSNRRGINCALIGYTLAPETTILTMVAEVKEALDFLGSMLKELGGDPTRVCLAGHSAGAHLAVCNRRHPMLSLVLGISGLYDLEAVMLSKFNQGLHLTPAQVEEASPIRHLQDAPGVPLMLSVGSEELPLFKEQTEDLARVARQAGHHVEVLEAPGLDHATVLDLLAEPQGLALKSILGFFGTLRNPTGTVIARPKMDKQVAV